MTKGKEASGFISLHKRRKAVITHIGDTNLVGVDHEASKSWGFHVHRLKRIFRSTEHLIMEGSEDSIDAANIAEPQGYEDLAISIARSKRIKIYPLESDFDLRPIAVPYGIDSSVVLAQTVFEGSRDVLENLFLGRLTDHETLQKYIIENSQHLKKDFLKNTSLTADDIVESINKTIVGVALELGKGVDAEQLVDNLLLGDSIIEGYLGRVRDYEEIGPRLTQLGYELSGRKTVVAGKKHVPIMKKVLMGLPLEQPLPWDAYKETLDPKEQEAVVVFERVSQGRAAT